MKNTGALGELLERLEDFDVDEDTESRPLILFAREGANAGLRSPALICPSGENSSSTCPLDSSMSELTSVAEAREALRVWSRWREGRAPSPQDRLSAVLFYARYGTFLPAEPDQEGM